jgi:hypothetical protein
VLHLAAVLSARARADFLPLLELRRNAEIVRAEDVRAPELQQLGLRSAIHVPGRFTPPDRLVHDYDLWILDHVIGNAGP